jgi:hypothetical protein
MSEKFTIQMGFAGLMIFLCAIFILIDLYLAVGWIPPDLAIRIDQRIRKFLRKPPIIVLDPWYIRKRNARWFVWLLVLSQVLIVASAFIVKLLE